MDFTNKIFLIFVKNEYIIVNYSNDKNKRNK